MDRDLHRAHADMDTTHWWFVGRRRVIAATLDRYVPRQGSVVDVGCGAGGMLPTLGRYGSVFAVEIDESAARTAATRNPSATVVAGALPDVLDGAPSATLATAFDVIEHLDDDVAALESIRSKVEPDAVVCVTVPALPWLWSAHDEANHHRRRYTRRTLRSALEAAGFTVVHMSYFNTLLFPLVVLARVVERVTGGGGGGDFDRSLGPLDRLLEWVFSLERLVVPRVRLPVGVSLIAVATPR